MTNNDFTKGADDSAMTSRQRARPALRLVKPGQRSGVNAFSASAVSSFELTGLLQGVDKPPRAAALATFIEGLLDGEGFDVVHTTDRPGNRPSRYSLEVRLHQRIPVRPQALSEAMAQCLGSAQPSLAFAQTGGAPGLPGPANGFADHETRLLTDRPAGRRVVGRSG